MVTLVSFLLTIYTKFRQLKTNLQALCCLTERIKKGKPTIKVTAEVFSRGLLQAPAEPWTEAPAGAIGVPQSGSAGWQRLGWTESLQTEQHSTSHKPPSTRLLKGCTGEEKNSRAAAHTPSHLPPLLQQGSRAASATHCLSSRKSLVPGKCSQENKKRQKEWTDLLYGVWLFLDKSDIYFDMGKHSYKA